jgi:hypothetical protein
MQRTQRLSRVVCAVVLCSLGALGIAQAQGREDTAIVSVNAGLQAATRRLSENVSLFKNVEQTPLSATLGNKGVPVVDLGGTIRIIGRLGANVAFTSVSNTGSAAVSAEIPHPFYFNRLRPISGEASVAHKEQVFHTDAALVLPSESMVVVVFGGPSFFSVKKDFVTDVTFNESYPYDTATFASATLTPLSASVTGFNAGVDLTWRLGPQWGVGGIVRYSRAEVPFKSGDLDFGTLNVGGLQAGGGLRLIF